MSSRFSLLPALRTVHEMSLAHTHRNRSTQRLFETLESRFLLAADPIISEIQAANESTMADADGDFSDWIELFNPDTTAVDLGHWYLTDDATDLRKWQFPPDTTLPPHAYMWVFASGKNRTDPGELHTNFRLAASGEFLSLVRPDGVTMVQTFSPFPEQEADTSYGLAAGRNVAELISSNQKIRSLVPTDDSLGTSWIDTGFDDSQWRSGNQAAGYEVLNQGFTVRDEFEGPLDSVWTVDNPGNATIGVQDGGLLMDLPEGFPVSVVERGAAPIVYRDLPRFAEEPGVAPTAWELTAHITKQPDDRGSMGVMVFDGATETPALRVQYSRRLNFEFFANDERLSFIRDSDETSYFLRIARDDIAKRWTASYKPFEAEDWTVIGEAFDGVDGVPVILEPKPAVFATTASSTVINTRFESVEINVPEERPAYGPLIELDLGNDLGNRNSSVYLRVPFEVDTPPETFDELAMNVRFDDGFRAYLNGVLVTEANAPLAPPPPAPDVIPWNAQAQASHGAVRGRIPVSRFELNSFLENLRAGQNVLAVQGLNISPADKDFFFQANLFASQSVLSKAQLFTNPSPGAPNAILSRTSAL